MLRTIQVDDNLSGKTLVLDFSSLSYAAIADVVELNTSISLITTDNGTTSQPTGIMLNHNAQDVSIEVVRNGSVEVELLKINTDDTVVINETTYELHPTFGTVNDTTEVIGYDCIKIDDGTHQHVYAICENMCMEETMTKGQMNNKFQRKITHGTSDPTGGEDGDIYIKYS